MIDPGTALRQGLLGLGRSDRARRVAERAGLGRSTARRLVAGETTQECVRTVHGLVAAGRLATVEFLAADPVDAGRASRTRDTHLELLRALTAEGLTAGGATELVVDLDKLGRSLPEEGAKIALDNARQLCEAAAAAGTTVTVDAGDHTTTDATLDTVRALRADFPSVGIGLHARLRRTEDDCRELATEGSRVLLSDGGAPGPESVAFQGTHDIGLSYVRCMKILLEGSGHPALATHDPRLIEIARSLVDKELRAKDSLDFQLHQGIRSKEQQALVDAGYRVRVHVAYGDDWYAHVLRRVAEHPAQTRFLLRSDTTKG